MIAPPPDAATGTRSSSGEQEQEAGHVFSSDSVALLLHEVWLLLSHVQRLPDTRLALFFRAKSERNRDPAAKTDPVPPTCSQSYFLDRIAAIAATAAAGPQVRPDGFSDPPNTKSLVEEGDPGPRLSDLAFLLWARDFLAAVVYPASVETIRVTRAFRISRGRRFPFWLPKPPKEYVTDHERSLWKYGGKIARRVTVYHGLTMFFILLSVWASFLVFSGQVLIRENDALKSDQKDLAQRIALAEKDDRRELDAAMRRAGHSASYLQADYCELSAPLDTAPPNPTPAASWRAPSQGTAWRGKAPARALNPVTAGSASPRLASSVQRDAPLPAASPQQGDLAGQVSPGEAAGHPDALHYLSPQQKHLCEEEAVLKRRSKELKLMHLFWLYSIQPLQSLVLQLPALPFGPPPLPREERSSEARYRILMDMDLTTHRYGMEQMVNGLIGAIMPVAYASLGALASLFRRLSRKVELETLSAADFAGMRTSLVLGILTGAVIGLFSDFIQGGNQHASIPLSTTALALLAGFASDRVFTMLDTIADRVFGRPDAERPSSPPVRAAKVSEST